MPEKRILKRRQLIYYLEVIDKETNKLVGHMVDISTEGMMVMTKAPIELQKTFCFKIPLKKQLGHKEYLQVNAKSMWSKKEMQANYYDTGFELLNVDPEDSRAIEYIVKTLCC